ncbi:hypothetical protein [Acidiphilium sp.]|uniref:hypothetical protein n=1 Tax=Acidiphilium sp. TaxID=527 RepID=UPI003D07A7A0
MLAYSIMRINIITLAGLAGLAGLAALAPRADAQQSGSAVRLQGVIAQTPPAVMGQSYPDFGAPEAPVVTDRFASQVVGESYPRLINPPTREAAPGRRIDETPMQRNAMRDPRVIVRNNRNFNPPMGN